MFVTVLGVPSRFSGVVVRIVRLLVNEIAGSHELIATRTVETFADAVRKLTKPHAVFSHESPDGALVAWLADQPAPLLVVLDDPATVAWELHLRRGHDVAKAARIVSTCMTVLELATRQPHAQLLMVQEHDADAPAALVEPIAQMLGLRLDAGQLARVQKLAASGDRVVAEESVRVPTDDPFLQVLANYRLGPANRTIDSLRWPAELHTVRAAHQPSAVWPVELAGRPRLLLHGPLFAVPRGHFRADVRFSTSDSFGNDITFRVVSGDILAEGRVPLPTTGDYETTITFAVDEPKKPVEWHFLLNTAAIEGTFRLRQSHIVRTSPM